MSSSTMNLLTLIMALSALLMPVSSAFSCGLCHEDNRAAVYSYEAIQKVDANPDQLEFVVLKVKGTLSKETVGNLSQWLSERAGVDATTIKISTLQKAVGFVFEKKYSKQDLISELQNDFLGLSFHVIEPEEKKKGG